MPVDGRRKKILLATRDAIKSATGGPDYFNNYSATGTCELGREPEVSVMEGAPAFVIRVYDGGERHNRDGGINMTASLDVIVAVFVKAGIPTLVERLQDILADINLVIFRNASLGGACTMLQLGSVDPPTYMENKAYAAVRIAAQYEYQAGQDR